MVVLILVLSTSLPFAQEAKLQENRFFPQTSFSISNDAIFNYFNARGGVNTFGLPISRAFVLLGDTVQIFQRQVIQIHNGSPTIMNLLGPDLMPYTSINGATLPGVDSSTAAAAPAVGSAGYGAAILDFVKNTAPDNFQGLPVNFGSTFLNTVKLQDAFPNGDGDQSLLPGMDLEIWGAPVSQPTFDPNNLNFVYQRFQRGVMMFDKTTGATQGMLLAQYFKAIITGNGLPQDLAQAAKNSPYYLQYNNANQLGLNNPALLPNTNMSGAFEPESPPGAPTYTPTPTFTPAPATPTPFVTGSDCKFDGQMIFVPQNPNPNDVVTVTVTSPTSYNAVNIVGPGSPHFIGAGTGGSGYVWQWRVLATESGLFNYDFFVNATQMCVSGFFVSGGATPTPGPTSTPTVTPTPTSTPTNTPAPSPVISSVNPPGGASRGTVITINGINFGANQTAANGTVLIGGNNAGSAIGGAWTSTSILITIPSNVPTGTQPIQVVANGQFSNSYNYTVNGP